MKSLPLSADSLVLFEWMDTPIWVFDPQELKMFWANPSALEFWNAPNLDEFLARDFSDMSESAKTRMQAVMSELQNGAVLHEQWTLYPKGTPVTARVSRVGIYLPSGTLASLQLAITLAQVDQSTLRGVEAIQHTNVLISLFSLKGVALMRNPSAIRTFGLLKPEAGLDDFAAMFENSSDLREARIDLENGDCFSAELPIHTLLGPKWHGIDARKVLDPVTGQPAILVNARDISDRKRAENAAQESLAAEKRFLASMSHEIRTPLNAVVGFIDLLRTTSLSDTQRQYVDNSQLSARLLLDLVSEILDVSKFDSGEVDIARSEFDLEELLLECLVVTSTRLKGGVELIYNLPELDCLVLGDPTRVKQIIINLLGNAAKFTKEGHIALSLDCVSPQSSDLVELRIDIEDTGIGIPDSKANTLFAPFRQAHDSSFGGTGLGLHLARSLARLMGGDVTFRSSDCGTTFCVDIRLDRGPDKSTKYSFSSLSILLFSQDPNTQSILSLGFPKSGANFTALPISTTLPQLLRTLLEQPAFPDILILDSQELAQSMSAVASLTKDLFPRTKIVALSSPDSPASQDRYDLRLDKPFSFYKLARSLRDLLDSAAKLPSKSLHDMHVLVVEDVEANIALAREMFRIHFGIEIDVAHDGAEAISKIQSTLYHVVFMDIQMPIMDGFEATRRLRAIGATVPIVAMTANAMSDQVQKAFDVGMSGYITKPVRRLQLEESLQKYCPAPPLSPLKSQRPRPSNHPQPPSSQPTIIERPPDTRPTNVGKDYRACAFQYFASILDETKADDLLKASIRSVAAIIPQLSAALVAQDQEALLKALHALKGLLLNSGITDPAERTARLEHELRAQNLGSSLLLEINRLVSEMKEFALEDKQ